MPTSVDAVCACDEVQRILLLAVLEIVEVVAHEGLVAVVQLAPKSALACQPTRFQAARMLQGIIWRRCWTGACSASASLGAGMQQGGHTAQPTSLSGTGKLTWPPVAPVRVKPLLRAPVPAYCREISSPWLAHITLKRASSCTTPHHHARRRLWSCVALSRPGRRGRRMRQGTCLLPCAMC